MRQLIYLTSAYQDLLEIQRYIARASGHLSVATHFTQQIQRQCAKLAALRVMLGRPRPDLRPDIRSVPFKGYVIFFRYIADTVEVVNILQAARDIDVFFHTDPNGGAPP